MTRYIRDVLAEMPVFRDRARPLARNPHATCSRATFEQMAVLPAPEPEAKGIPRFLAALPPIGSIAIHCDDSVPDGFVDLDGERLAVADLVAFVQAAGN